MIECLRQLQGKTVGGCIRFWMSRWQWALDMGRKHMVRGVKLLSGAGLSGVFVMLIGLAALGEALEYDLGSVRQIGPAVFPAMLGILMVILGGGIFFGDLRSVCQGLPGDVASDRRSAPVRGLVFITAGVVVFGFVLERLGFVPAILVAVMLSAQADRDLSLKARVLIAVGLSVVCSVVFIKFLQLPLQIVAF